MAGDAEAPLIPPPLGHASWDLRSTFASSLAAVGVVALALFACFTEYEDEVSPPTCTSIIISKKQQPSGTQRSPSLNPSPGPHTTPQPHPPCVFAPTPPCPGCVLAPLETLRETRPFPNRRAPTTA